MIIKNAEQVTQTVEFNKFSIKEEVRLLANYCFNFQPKEYYYVTLLTPSTIIFNVKKY